MNNIRTFYGSPTADGYYTTFDSSEVHRVDGGSEGGGGSSDFSTATVTLTETVSGEFLSHVNGPIIGIVAQIEGLVTIVWGDWTAIDTVTWNVVLYDGAAILNCAVAYNDCKATVTSGDAEVFTWTDDYGTYEGVLIHGDCSISYSPRT